MCDSPEIVKAMQADSDEEREIQLANFALRASIMGHRTFFCPCDVALDIRSAVLIQHMGSDKAWRDTLVMCGNHENAEYQQIVKNCHDALIEHGVIGDRFRLIRHNSITEYIPQ